jgi:diphosphomevalonate decarboxylase
MKVQASAPSNIALIKYMGKKESEGQNQPTNSSLSWTLDNLRSFVDITLREDLSQDEWTALEGSEYHQIQLNQKSQDRFLAHFQNLKTQFGIRGHFLIQSANNFPADCGLASSASSFAALTLAATEMFEKLGNKEASNLSILDKAELSRLGSGSSCRSFFGPWALWFAQGVRPVEFPMKALKHQVVVVESGIKQVSSSQAHQRVLSSALFEGRPERAEKRLARLMDVFRTEQTPETWYEAYQLVWSEFWDMHALFETSEPAFGYLLPESLKVLKFLDQVWKEQKDGPIVTMDAGPNVHLLYRHDQVKLAERIASELSSQAMKVI